MKILVVDDDNLVAMSLKTILSSDSEIEVVGTGNSGEDAIKLYEEYKPDLLLMDIRMKGMSGLEAGTEIISKNPDAKILYLTTFNDDEYIVSAINLGAKGYIIKQDFDGIIPAVKLVCQGQCVFGNGITQRLPEMIKKNGGSFDYASYGITPQEKEIIEEVANGLSNKEIADKLFLSEGTVRNYLSNILRKLDIRDRTNLAIFYYQNK
ncbi:MULTISPECIES: response regulator [Eubacterium]|jgi:DNA-binding NarL/FixJ family response regulator|uniref:Stage 0 sporulation protein A homolog n=1 Tax=Eubacterium ruminantium TaxID=42322 RepID=A0A1T4MDX7_9FIRM|nr:MULTISPECIES: response regulator transcription factor [Eubacterium]MCR5369066.1 response regulator transcription factor [Eubacterium sp.]SCW47290.1 DNA-binding response regulator, NarL/FixJ family, contains REC and HTH domains [Eubacterium ruminantium]SDM54659.1 two component transcriptional regulator, LuxR family [Eubacterium ruminantium]SJZ65057.1 two component transcriptional regulator, LuxR family [Eubacterium ruminantium]